MESHRLHRVNPPADPAALRTPLPLFPFRGTRPPAGRTRPVWLDASSATLSHFEGAADRLQPRRLLLLQPRPDLLELPNRLLRINAAGAADAHFGLDLQ